MTTPYDIVVIGAGPAGISMAVEARAAGVAHEKILLLERAPEHSFTLKKYYPDEKLVTANYKGFEAVCTGVMCMSDLSKSATISYLDRTLQEYGIPCRYEETVHKIHRHEATGHFTVSTDKGEYDARVVVIAIGILGKPNKPDYPLPRTLKGRLLFDVTSVPIVDSRVLVVGGGDSASEYCQYLVQKGNRVALSYRRQMFSRMNHINEESLATLVGEGQVELLLGTNIAAIADVGGLPEIRFREAGIPPRQFDIVLYALGGSTPENFLKTVGIEFNGASPHLLEGYETSVPGMFLVGDLSAGSKGGSIIWAFNSANTAIRKICRDHLHAGGTA